MGEVRIGTSGWHYTHWRGPFYPAGLPASRMLAYYAREFDTVEVNNSFYRLPERATFEAWRKATPAGFCFAVKASRYITHMKKLTDPTDALARFFAAAGGLGDKLGPVLFQLPPRWHCDLSRLEAFLAVLPSRRRYAMEFRDPSWHDERVYALLAGHNVAFCVFDLAGTLSPLRVTADFAYVRLHGPGDKYQGRYDRATLRAWARRVRSWSRDLAAVHVYFDNDQAGYAVINARELRDLVKD